ncbi:MAG: hypothetical protein QM653_10985 [Dysgonomonas sp.]|uniref:hypothetical protein n=1 Tax=Dysgonomonas sp. TaxID=1891233 RepID=UPI0039E443A3
MDDVADSDHLFVLSDKSDKPIIEGSRGATNQPGGKVISILASDYANDNWFSNTLLIIIQGVLFMNLVMQQVCLMSQEEGMFVI